MIGIVVVVAVFIGGGLLLGLSELIADEMRGWLELVPRGILRLVAIRLPADQRETIYCDEWLPELLHKLRKGEERPISRLVIGIWFAVSMARGAGKVARELQDVREREFAQVQEQEPEILYFAAHGDRSRLREYLPSDSLSSYLPPGLMPEDGKVIFVLDACQSGRVQDPV